MKKIIPSQCLKLDLQISSLSLYQLSNRDIVINEFENYQLKDFKNHTADLGPVLVDPCLVWREKSWKKLGLNPRPPDKCAEEGGK